MPKTEAVSPIAKRQKLSSQKSPSLSGSESEDEDEPKSSEPKFSRLNTISIWDDPEGLFKDDDTPVGSSAPTPRHVENDPGIREDEDKDEYKN